MAAKIVADRARFFFNPPRTYVPDLDGNIFAAKLLRKKGVCGVPGEIFDIGHENHSRMTVLQPEEKLVEAIDRMEEVLV
jgi:aspartate/methionine/tyrosine aminotransferase